MKNLYVIKCGGGFVEQPQYLSPLLKAVKKLVKKGNHVVMVHGGGLQVDNLAMKLKVSVKKINGRRITDSQTLQITKMIYAGLVNTDLVSACIANGIAAVGISGVSGKIAEVIKRPKVKNVDFGHVGDIKKINEKVLLLLVENNFLPIVSCLGVDAKGKVFNINADGLATQIAIKLKAKKLIFVSDVQGVATDKHKDDFLQTLSFKKAEELMTGGIIADGMIPKIENSYAALEKNVENVQIVGALETIKEWESAILNGKFGTKIILGGHYE